MNIYDEAGETLDLYERLRATAQTPHCLAVRVHEGAESIEGYVHAYRLPPAQAAEARRRARAAAKKKGRCVQQRTLVLAEWVLIFTTLPPELLPTATIAALYRVRGQAELVIKRLKSLLDLDRLRARESSARAELYLHGKLL
jgi:IS4 transposase